MFKFQRDSHFLFSWFRRQTSDFFQGRLVQTNAILSSLKATLLGFAGTRVVVPDVSSFWQWTFGSAQSILSSFALGRRCCFFSFSNYKFAAAASRITRQMGGATAVAAGKPQSYRCGRATLPLGGGTAAPTCSGALSTVAGGGTARGTLAHQRLTRTTRIALCSRQFSYVGRHPEQRTRIRAIVC